MAVKSTGAEVWLAFSAIIALIFFAPLIGVLVGAFSGWIVGLVFSDTILAVLAGLGFSGTVAVWQFGAFLGFVGGFFRVQRRDIKVQEVK